DGQGDEVFRVTRRRAEVALSLNDGFQHDGSLLQAAGSALASATPKSSGKCSSADSTGYGAMPPRAHSEPPSMVSHRSRSSATCCMRPGPPVAILSMVSTPRTEPMRQGVHLPQDSMAQ